MKGSLVMEEVLVALLAIIAVFLAIPYIDFCFSWWYAISKAKAVRKE